MLWNIMPQLVGILPTVVIALSHSSLATSRRPYTLDGAGVSISVTSPRPTSNAADLTPVRLSSRMPFGAEPETPMTLVEKESSPTEERHLEVEVRSTRKTHAGHDGLDGREV